MTKSERMEKGKEIGKEDGKRQCGGKLTEEERLEA